MLPDRNDSLFPSVPPTAWGHFTLCYLAAVFRVMHRCRGFAEESGSEPDSLFESFPFLKQEYLADVLSQLPEPMSWADVARWWPEALRSWEENCAVHLPLRSLREQAALSFDQLMALLIACLVEEDGRFGPLFDSMQSERMGRPTAPLLARLAAGEEAGGAAADLSLIYQPLLTAGLLTVRTPTAPRSGWVLVMPPLLWDLVRGQTGAPLWPDSKQDLPQYMRPDARGGDYLKSEIDIRDFAGRKPRQIKVNPHMITSDVKGTAEVLFPRTHETVFKAQTMEEINKKRAQFGLQILPPMSDNGEMGREFLDTLDRRIHPSEEALEEKEGSH